MQGKRSNLFRFVFVFFVLLLLPFWFCDEKDVGMNMTELILNQFQLDEVDVACLEVAEIDFAFDVAAFALAE